jgi:hypothetical protein
MLSYSQNYIHIRGEGFNLCIEWHILFLNISMMKLTTVPLDVSAYFKHHESCSYTYHFTYGTVSEACLFEDQYTVFCIVLKFLSIVWSLKMPVAWSQKHLF